MERPWKSNCPNLNSLFPETMATVCMACINHWYKSPFFYFPEKSTSAFVTTMHDSSHHQNDSDNGIPDTRDTGNRKKCETQDGFETGSSFEDKFNSCVGIKTFHTQTSRHAEPEVNALDYSEGWQERLLEKAKEMKAKHLARKRKVLQKRLVDEQTLEEKRCLVELYGSTGTRRNKSNKHEGINWDNNGSWLMGSGYESPTGSLHKDISMGIYMDNHESQRVDGGSGYGYPRTNTDKRHVSYGIDIDKEDRTNMDNHGYQATQSDGKYLKRVGSSYENFRNNPVIIQPYRLEKFNSTKDEILLQRLNLDLDAAELPDQLRELIPRPKSAPSIPSKCRKYVLVATDSETTSCDRPAPTALEEMLMSQRFPKSNLGQFRSRSCSPLVSEIRRPCSLQKMQNVNMSCK